MDHSSHRSSRTPRLLGFGLVAAVALVVATSLTQCRMVDDRITSVDLKAGASARSTCMQRCMDQFRARKRAEDQRYRNALAACGDDRNCRKDEKQTHKERDASNVRMMQECKRTCYNEGAGLGGR